MKFAVFSLPLYEKRYKHYGRINTYCNMVKEHETYLILEIFSIMLVDNDFKSFFIDMRAGE